MTLFHSGLDGLAIKPKVRKHVLMVRFCVTLMIFTKGVDFTFCALLRNRSSFLRERFLGGWDWEGYSDSDCIDGVVLWLSVGVTI